MWNYVSGKYGWIRLQQYEVYAINVYRTLELVTLKKNGSRARAFSPPPGLVPTTDCRTHASYDNA